MKCYYHLRQRRPARRSTRPSPVARPGNAFSPLWRTRGRRDNKPSAASDSGWTSSANSAPSRWQSQSRQLLPRIKEQDPRRSVARTGLTGSLRPAVHVHRLLVSHDRVFDTQLSFSNTDNVVSHCDLACLVYFNAVRWHCRQILGTHLLLNYLIHYSSMLGLEYVVLISHITFSSRVNFDIVTSICDLM